MNIYIDESGSFVSAPNRGAWNVVVAVTAPESARPTVRHAINMLKSESGKHRFSEAKLNDLSESQYVRFAQRLAQSHVLLLATATDAGLNSPDLVAAHQQAQVAKIRENIPRMKYEGGRRGVELLAAQVEGLSPQLYAQLTCQVNLFDDVVRRSINYYAQRIPASLREFRWRIDQKNTSRTDFEDAFEKIVPILLQTRSMREPGVRVEGFDYRHLKDYELGGGEVPERLYEEYGVKVTHGRTVQRLIRKNLRFEDSTQNVGIQVADLLASGLRRCLRLGFKDNTVVAHALGGLMLQNQKSKYPIDLISFTDGDIDSDQTASVIKSFGARCRRLLTR